MLVIRYWLSYYWSGEWRKALGRREAGRRWRLAGSVARCRLRLRTEDWGLPTADSLSANTRMQAGSGVLPAQTQITSLCSVRTSSKPVGRTARPAIWKYSLSLIGIIAGLHPESWQPATISQQPATRPPWQMRRPRNLFHFSQSGTLKCPQRKFIIVP